VREHGVIAKAGIESKADMPQEPRSLRFETRDGIDLHCLAWDAMNDDPQRANPPIILLHGGGANAHWWDHLARRMTGRQAVYALDFRGHGDSAFPETRRVGAFNDDLEAMVEWLGRDDLLFVGHSMGAAVALDHASRFESTRGLVLVDLARGGVAGSGRPARLALSLRRTYRTREDAIERFRFLPESSHAQESLRRHVAENSVRQEPDGRFGYKFDPAWFGLPARPRPDPSQVHCRTLLVRGGESTLLSSEAAIEFASQLANGEMIEIPQAGHHVLIDQPEALLDAIMALFDRIRESL
jgi:pimeloyl-ACP methyl ester carboxylesterase